MMKVDLTGRVALVTGAAQNIGKAIADVYAENGARVIYTDIHLPAAQAAAARKTGCSALAMDVTDERQVQAAIDQTVLFYGKDAMFGDRLKQMLAHIPLGRPGAVEDIAYAALYLAAPESNYVNGHVLTVAVRLRRRPPVTYASSDLTSRRRGLPWPTDGCRASASW